MTVSIGSLGLRELDVGGRDPVFYAFRGEGERFFSEEWRNGKREETPYGEKWDLT